MVSRLASVAILSQSPLGASLLCLLNVFLLSFLFLFLLVILFSFVSLFLTSLVKFILLRVSLLFVILFVPPSLGLGVRWSVWKPRGSPGSPLEGALSCAKASLPSHSHEYFLCRSCVFVCVRPTSHPLSLPFFVAASLQGTRSRSRPVALRAS